MQDSRALCEYHPGVSARIRVRRSGSRPLPRFERPENGHTDFIIRMNPVFREQEWYRRVLKKSPLSLDRDRGVFLCRRRRSPFPCHSEGAQRRRIFFRLLSLPCHSEGAQRRRIFFVCSPSHVILRSTATEESFSFALPPMSF